MCLVGGYDSSHDSRQRVRDHGYRGGEEPAGRVQLLGVVAGRDGPASGGPRHAHQPHQRGERPLVPRPRGVRHVDLHGRALLHGVHPAPRRHLARPLLGRVQHRLHSAALCKADHHHGRHRVVRRRRDIHSATVRLEARGKPRLDGDVRHQSGQRLYDILHGRRVLFPLDSYASA